VKEKSERLGRSAVLLAAIGIVAKLIGALYRVPLTNIVGAEGMGLYQMVFPLYTVLLAFCGGGFTNAVSRVVAKYTARGDNASAVRTVRAAIIPLAVVSALSAAAVALLRNAISGLQGNTEAAIAYLALCPSLLFAGGISVFRGYFQGKSQMLPSGISQLIEQIVKLFLGLYLSKVFLRYGVRFAVAGALIGVSVSELLALLYLAVRYAVSRKRAKRYVPVLALGTEASAEFAPERYVTDRELIKELYSFALPVTLGSLVLPLTQMIDSVLVINLLMYGGAGRADSTALFGLLVGPVGTLVNMPVVIVLSVSIAYLPAVTTAVERGADVSGITRDAAKWIMLFVIPVTAVFMLFPDRVCAALYRRGLTSDQLAVASNLLRVQAVGVFYVGMLQLCTTVLQGYNKAHRPVINLIVGACVKVALTPALVRLFGIIGAAGATTACYAVAATLTARSAYKCTALNVSALDALLKPLAFTLAASAAFYGTVVAAEHGQIPSLWASIIGAAVFAAVYFGGIAVSGALSAGDVKRLIPRSKK